MGCWTGVPHRRKSASTPNVYVGPTTGVALWPLDGGRQASYIYLWALRVSNSPSLSFLSLTLSLNMQIFCLLPLLAALASSVVGAAVRRDDANNCGSEIGCNLGLAKRGDSVQLPTRTVRELTNAERMRRGLPLKPPVRRGELSEFPPGPRDAVED